MIFKIEVKNLTEYRQRVLGLSLKALANNTDAGVTVNDLFVAEKGAVPTEPKLIQLIIAYDLSRCRFWRLFGIKESSKNEKKKLPKSERSVEQ